MCKKLKNYFTKSAAALFLGIAVSIAIPPKVFAENTVSQGAAQNAEDTHSKIAYQCAYILLINKINTLMQKSPHAKDFDGFTALHYAALIGDLKTCDYLINIEGASIYAKSRCGISPLDLVKLKGDKSTYDYLINKGCADLIKKMPFNLVPQNDISIERVNVYPEIYNYLLIARKISITENMNESQFLSSNLTPCGKHVTPNPEKSTVTHIHQALRHEDIANFKKVLLGSDNINIKNKNGNTVLHTAIFKNNNLACDILLNLDGVDINATNNRGFTPLKAAIFKNNVKVCQTLLSKGAHFNKEIVSYALNLNRRRIYNILSSKLPSESPGSSSKSCDDTLFASQNAEAKIDNLSTAKQQSNNYSQLSDSQIFDSSQLSINSMSPDTYKVISVPNKLQNFMNYYGYQEYFNLPTFSRLCTNDTTYYYQPNLVNNYTQNKNFQTAFSKQMPSYTNFNMQTNNFYMTKDATDGYSSDSLDDSLLFEINNDDEIKNNANEQVEPDKIDSDNIYNNCSGSGNMTDSELSFEIYDYDEFENKNREQAEITNKTKNAFCSTNFQYNENLDNLPQPLLLQAYADTDMCKKKLEIGKSPINNNYNINM